MVIHFFSLESRMVQPANEMSISTTPLSWSPSNHSELSSTIANPQTLFVQQQRQVGKPAFSSFYSKETWLRLRYWRYFIENGIKNYDHLILITFNFVFNTEQ
jgi:hypothetical protein